MDKYDAKEGDNWLVPMLMGKSSPDWRVCWFFVLKSISELIPPAFFFFLFLASSRKRAYRLWP